MNNYNQNYFKEKKEQYEQYLKDIKEHYKEHTICDLFQELKSLNTHIFRALLEKENKNEFFDYECFLEEADLIHKEIDSKSRDLERKTFLENLKLQRINYQLKINRLNKVFNSHLLNKEEKVKVLKEKIYCLNKFQNLILDEKLFREDFYS